MTDRGDRSEWDPVGIDTSATFRRYVSRLRETWSTDSRAHAGADVCATEHGSPTDIRYSDYFQMSVSDSGSEAEAQQETTMIDAPLTRRRMMKGTAAAAVLLAVGTGAASANTGGGLNYGSDMVPNPTAPVTFTAAENDGDMGQFEYYDDDGNVVDLRDHGARVAPRPEPDDDDDEVAYNAVTLRADHIKADPYTRFPADETYETDDDDEEDLSALDAQHWTENGATVADQDSPAGGYGLNVTGSDGNTATFDDFDFSSGINRTYVQVGFTVNNLDDNASVHFNVGDGTDWRTATIEEGGDTDADEIIGDGTEDAAVRQVEIGDLAGDDLDSVGELQIEIEGGSADIDIFALSVERSTRWEFGEYESLDEDDEVEIDTVYEPEGDQSYRSYDSLAGWVRDADLRDLTIEAEIAAENLPDADVDHVFDDAERYDEDYEFRLIQNFEIPTAHDLTLDFSDMVDEQVHPSGRYLTAKVLTDDHDPFTIEDVDDDEMDDAIGIANEYDGSIEDEATVTSQVSQGETTSVYFEILVRENEREEIEATPEPDDDDDTGPIFGGGREGRGITDMIFTVPGMIVTGIVTYVGFVAARARGLVPWVGR